MSETKAPLAELRRPPRGQSQIELFTDSEVDEFATAIQRYGVWPITVWPCDHSDQKTRRLRALIGDVDDRDGENTRHGSLAKLSDSFSLYGGKVTASIFNPAVAAWLLNCFAPAPPALVFDPFAGGGTRAIMATRAGYDYVGAELRADEVRAVEGRCVENGVEEATTVIEADAKDLAAVRRGWPVSHEPVADFLMTCPPYWNLERYEGGDDDLSMAPTYEAFLEQLGVVIANTRTLLRPGAWSCWIVGLHRDRRGRLLALNHDVARLHQEHGFDLREEIILHQLNTGAIRRVGKFDKGWRRLIRVHEYALVFKAPTGDNHRRREQP